MVISSCEQEAPSDDTYRLYDDTYRFTNCIGIVLSLPLVGGDSLLTIPRKTGSE